MFEQFAFIGKRVRRLGLSNDDVEGKLFVEGDISVSVSPAFSAVNEATIPAASAVSTDFMLMLTLKPVLIDPFPKSLTMGVVPLIAVSASVPAPVLEPTPEIEPASSRLSLPPPEAFLNLASISSAIPSASSSTPLAFSSRPLSQSEVLGDASI